jgi:hypothetical protein
MNSVAGIPDGEADPGSTTNPNASDPSIGQG